MKLYSDYPRIVTVFDEGLGYQGGAIYATTIRNTLRRIFPDPLFFDHLDEERFEELSLQFHQTLPLLRWSKIEGVLSLFFIVKHRLNISRFFYEMICRWLKPGQQIDIAFFFTTDFRLPDLSTDLYTFAEMAIRLSEIDDFDQIEHNLRIIETEIKLGMVSIYHTSRILEMHASSNEKMTLLQEKISYLIQRRPDQIDFDIFAEMQHFLVMSKDEFKVPRDVFHLSRLISCFYLFRKLLQADVEQFPDKRHVRLKLAAVNLNLPLGWKRVLGICVALNFLRQGEVFEERHLIKAINNAITDIKIVQDSFFVNEGIEDNIAVSYVEIEKGDGKEFSLEEVRKMRHFLPEELKRSIEVGLRPVFMPRNEEEVIRHIVSLSGELHFVRDIPQLILTFEGQKEGDLSFNVILVRVLFSTSCSIQSLFEQKKSFLTYIHDRVKRIGMVRKKYPKEATVFQIRFSSYPFLRDDHFVDLYRARQAVIKELERILGEVRDYYGGMIIKQLELLEDLKREIGGVARQDEFLLENFFHSLYPIEMRSILTPQPLKKLFHLWREVLQEGQKRIEVEPGIIFVMGRIDFSSKFESIQLSDTELLIAKPEIGEEKFWGYIYFCEDERRRQSFLSVIDVKELTH